MTRPLPSAHSESTCTSNFNSSCFHDRVTHVTFSTSSSVCMHFFNLFQLPRVGFAIFVHSSLRTYCMSDLSRLTKCNVAAKLPNLVRPPRPPVPSCVHLKLLPKITISRTSRFPLPRMPRTLTSYHSHILDCIFLSSDSVAANVKWSRRRARRHARGPRDGRTSLKLLCHTGTRRSPASLRGHPHIQTRAASSHVAISAAWRTSRTSWMKLAIRHILPHLISCCDVRFLFFTSITWPSFVLTLFSSLSPPLQRTQKTGFLCIQRKHHREQVVPGTLSLWVESRVTSRHLTTDVGLLHSVDAFRRGRSLCFRRRFLSPNSNILNVLTM